MDIGEQVATVDRREQDRLYAMNWRRRNPDYLRKYLSGWYRERLTYAKLGKVPESALLFKRMFIALAAQELARRRDVRRKQTRESMRRYPERNKKNADNYRERNRKYRSDYFKARYAANRESEISRSKAYFAANKEKAMAQKKRRQRERTQQDPIFRIICNFRKQLSVFVTRCFKKVSTENLIGCSRAELRAHLESQFTAGMDWGNYGRGLRKWTIDHILPISSFDMSDAGDQVRCWHFSNLQPLWFVDNVRKGNKIL